MGYGSKKKCIVCKEWFFNVRINKNGWRIGCRYTNKRWKTAKYCSQKCYWNDYPNRPHNGEGKGIKGKCLICGKIVKKGGRNREQVLKGICYCSQECFHKSRIGIKFKITGKGLENIRRASKIHGLSIRGKNAPNWKGGVSRKNHRRENIKYREWRKAVYRRDFWTCQDCREKQKHPIAHHLKGWNEYPNLRYMVENGITLCRGCHKKRHEEIGQSTRF